jgi:hypothetical protein
MQSFFYIPVSLIEHLGNSDVLLRVISNFYNYRRQKDR